MFNDSSTTASIGRVKNTLEFSLKNKYGIENDATTEKILKIHGLSKDNFDFIKNYETIIEKGIADASLDANANKTDVSISGLLGETTIPVNKIVGYRYLYRKMSEMYGKKRAKFLSGEMYDMSLAIADSGQLLKNYCFSIDASKLVFQGRPFGQLPSLPPNRVSSYIAALCETIHQLSNHLAGAIAIGTLFLDVAFIVLDREKKTLNDIKNDKVFRKYIENSFQSFIHSVNHLSRNSVESPFTNISIFDRPKLYAILDNENMGWYPAMVQNKMGKEEKEWLDYFVNLVMELQNIYMEVVDRGDVSNNGAPIRFPVNTLNLSKTEINGKVVAEDEDFLNEISKKEIYRYNVYVSEGMKVSSCCRLINDADLFKMGGQVNSFGGSAISLGSHRVSTINLRRISLECNSFENYMEILKNRMDSSADILIAHRELMKDMIKKGTQPFSDNGWLPLNKMFSTFGLLGYYEAVKDLEDRFGKDKDYLAEILKFINDYAAELTQKRHNIFNIEQIPAETMSAKLANIDRIIFGEEKVQEKLYANQFVPLFEQGHSLWERMDLDGKYGSFLTGGGIVHFSLGEKITSKQVRKIIDYALESHNEYFALNPVYSVCSNKEHKHTSFGKFTVCPVCGEPVEDYVTRTVGFFVKVSNMTTTKKKEDFEKRDYKGIE